LNAAIQEEWPAPDTHARRLREWLEDKADEVRNGNGDQEDAGQKDAGQKDAGQANVGAPPARPTS
jgi:membrane protein